MKKLRKNSEGMATWPRAAWCRLALSLIICHLSFCPAGAQKHLARYYASRAESYVQSNSWNEAKREIDEGLADWPDDPDLRYLNGRFYYVTGHLNEARYNLIKAIQGNDQHFRAKRVMVDVEDDAKHYSSAICYINELLEFQPYDRDLWRRKIGLYRKLNNHMEADAALERLARIYPNDTLVVEDLKKRHRENTGQLFSKSTLEETAAELEKWVELDPYNLNYYLELMGVYQRMGMYDRAIGVGNRGLTYFPDNQMLVNKLVGLLSDMGFHTQALSIARKHAPHSLTYRTLLQDAAAEARQHDPYEMYGRLYAETHDRDALTYLLNTSLTRGYFDDARFYLQDAMKREGRTTPLLMKLYDLEKRTGNENEQRKVLVELYEKNPADEELTSLYADMMFKLGATDMAQQQWADANIHLQRAIELMPQNHESWPAVVSMRIACLGHLNRLDLAQDLYRQAATVDAPHRDRYASAYEDIVASRLHVLIEEENYEQALSEAQDLLELIPQSETALRTCINMSQTLNREQLFQAYAEKGYEAFPQSPYFLVKQAVALQHQNRYIEALVLVKPKTGDGEFASPLITAAHSGITGEWAGELLKLQMPDFALQVLDTALVHDPKNRELLYMKGLVYESKKDFRKAYYYEKRYYEPSNAEQQEYYEHMRYLGFKGMRNRVDAAYTYAAYDVHAAELATRAHLYSLATISYSRVGERNTYTGQVSYKGIDGYHDEANYEAGGVGLELTAQWEHTFDHRWSGMANVSYSTKFFNKVGANASLSYDMGRGWTPSLRLGYRRTPETYLYLGDGEGIEVTHDKYHLFILSPSMEKSWERLKASAVFDLTALEHSIYYNVGLKGKLFFNDDNISSVSLLTGFGSFPELAFFEQTALRNVSHTNAMVGFDAQYLCTRHLYLGLAGNWNTCYSPYRTDEGTLRASYRNIYSVTLQLHVAF